MTLSVTSIGLFISTRSAGIVCALSLGNKGLHKMILNKCNKDKKQYQQTIKPFGKVYRKSLQDNVIVKKEYETLSNFLNKYLDDSKIESCLYK